MSKFSKVKITRLLRESDNAANSDIKGDKLEELTAYIFSKIPGVKLLDRNILNRQRSQELDVCFENIRHQQGLQFLDYILIVECKNTADSSASIDVASFIDKLRETGSSKGVYLSLSGISGSADGVSNAHAKILAAVREKIFVLLITREEILSLNTSDELVTLLKKKYLTLSLKNSIV